MGGIIVRTALLEWIPAKLGRIVMLGTPNAGSDAARRLAPRLGWLCPYLHELSDASDSYINTLPSPDGFEIGVIASPKDHVVPLESALAVPASDHALVRIRHGLIPCSRRVAREVVVFLETGHFSASASRRRATSLTCA